MHIFSLLDNIFLFISEAEKEDKEMEQSPEDMIYSEIPDNPINESKVILQQFFYSQYIQHSTNNYLLTIIHLRYFHN